MNPLVRKLAIKLLKQYRYDLSNNSCNDLDLVDLGLSDSELLDLRIMMNADSTLVADTELVDFIISKLVMT